MRKYDRDDETAIRLQRLVREWTQSGLLDRAQEERIRVEIAVDLRRTNLFLRLILFAFGLLIIGASVLLVGVTFSLNREVSAGTLCFASGIASFAFAEYLISGFRMYRFGIEEAGAIAGGILFAAGAAILVSAKHAVFPVEFPILIALIVGAIAGWAIYLRYGYLYATVLAMWCTGLAPYQTALSQIAQRLLSVSLLLLVFVVARSKYRERRGEFRGDDCSVIQAVAWLGIYTVLNVRLSSLGSILWTTTVSPGPFYWLTYAAIWVIPGLGFVLAIRERTRPLLDVSIALFLVSLATNKAYLGRPSQTWDPILFGILLIASAVAIRRWLSTGNRNGFTAERILTSDQRRVSVIGTASAAMQTVPSMPADSVSVRNFEGGGGRSGGGGATGAF